MKTIQLALVTIITLTALNLSCARADQPHMQRALERLREAKAELQTAEHDKGGWRAKAVRHVEEAIRETERGLAFDRHH